MTLLMLFFLTCCFKYTCVLLCFMSRFVSFHETAQADAVLGYLIAFLVLLATVKLWHLLRLNPKLHMITATLQRAWTDISGFLVVIAIMFLAYSVAVRSFPHLTSTFSWSPCISFYFIQKYFCPKKKLSIFFFQSNLMYGWKLYSYRTLLEAAQTIVSLQLGIFNYEEVSGGFCKRNAEDDS